MRFNREGDKGYTADITFRMASYKFVENIPIKFDSGAMITMFSARALFISPVVEVLQELNWKESGLLSVNGFGAFDKGSLNEAFSDLPRGMSAADKEALLRKYQGYVICLHDLDIGGSFAKSFYCALFPYLDKAKALLGDDIIYNSKVIHEPRSDVFELTQTNWLGYNSDWKKLLKGRDTYSICKKLFDSVDLRFK